MTRSGNSPRWRAPLALLALAVGGTQAIAGESPSITGEVRSVEEQPIYTPFTAFGPLVIRYYVAEGSEVSPGQVVLRADPGFSASRLRTLDADIRKAAATDAKEIAELQVKAVDAELALVDADSNLKKAQVDAALPRELISALEFDRYSGELERTGRELQVKQKELDSARASIVRRGRDSELELKRMRLEYAFNQSQLAAAEVRAERAGVVLHALDPRGKRLEEGSTSFPGLLAGDIVTAGRKSVRAYALEPERAYFRVGAEVSIDFDALPETMMVGKIEAISGAPEPRPVWGEGRYYTIEIALNDEAQRLPLLPGMSARVRVLSADSARSAGQRRAVGLACVACAPRASLAGPLRVEGEIITTRTAPLAPPPLEDVWQLNIAEMKPEGTLVKTGEAVLRFEVGDLTKSLQENQNSLNEKRRQREQLELAVAERARDEELATADARAALEKALRKVSVPDEVIRRVDYKKLVIERARCEKRVHLYETRERLAADERDAERKLLEVQIDHLQGEVARLTDSIAALSVKAPLSGMLAYRTDFDDKKFAVGSQVWKGIAVAEIPDTSTLAIRAQLPERELLRVAVGDLARVHLEGGASTAVPAHVTRVARAVRSKSRVEPIPVIELLLEFERPPEGIRPGQQVQVEIDPTHRLSGRPPGI